MKLKFKKFNIKNERAIFTILIILLFILVFIYCNFILATSFARNSFANEAVKIAEENENPIFSIQKILLYSSANAIDNTEEQSLQNLSIYQFSDIAIYIDNTNSSSELTNENTVKQIYIDNIQINTNSEIGYPYLNYKNAYDFGKFKVLDENTSDRLDFDVVTTNTENENYDYSKPTFYTDCSNPITLGYMNKDIITNYSAGDNTNTISFNGKVLQETNVNLNDISYNLSFRINIINNLNEKFIYNMNLDINLADQENTIYNGYLYQGKTTSGTNYQFFREL